MKIEKLAEQKEKICLKKERLEKKEKMLREKERKLHTRQLIKSGELISKANISHLSPSVLLGALLEIKEKAQDKEVLREWETKGNRELSRDLKEGAQRLIVTFDSVLDEQAKNALKALKFRWNAFRREWYGFGEKESIERDFKAFGVKIEIASFFK